MTPNEAVIDVAIVGGGISGVYSGWRLRTSTGNHSSSPPLEGDKPKAAPSVTVFECSSRIGGRLLSLTPPGMPHIRCELGGMRYMSSHKYVRSLVENKLKLATEPLAVAEPGNIAYLRGKHLLLRDLTDPAKIPYVLDWVEQGRDPGDLVSWGINQIVPGAATLHGADLEKLLQTFQFEGKHIYNEGFWNLLARALSREAYEFAKQAGGYDTTLLNWNAADTIILNCDFSPTVTFKRIVDGFEQVPLTLCQQFCEAGGQLELNRTLASFETARLPDETDGVRLIFEDGKSLLARALILAMPRRSLELLAQTGPVLDASNHRVHNLIRQVTPIPLFKIFLCYHRPWWEDIRAPKADPSDASLTQGRSVTDLPLRQVYYWGVEGRSPGADGQNQNAALMATYDDTLNVLYWEGLRSKRHQALFDARPNEFADQHPASPDWKNYKAGACMVREVHRQLMEMHGVHYAPEAYDAAYMDWGDDPFGGGVNFWNIHAKSWIVKEQMIKPEPSVPVYVCGEAYSTVQGWAEGALQTAEMMLQGHFQLNPPEWVTES